MAGDTRAMARRVVVLALSVGLLVGDACSDDRADANDADRGGSSTTSEAGRTGSSTTSSAFMPDAADTTDTSDAVGVPDGDGSPSISPSGSASTVDGQGPPIGNGGDVGAPVVAEAGGWRLAVAWPTAGAKIAQSMTLCVEVAAPSREPAVMLDVSLQPAGPSGRAETVRIDGVVGRGPVSVRLPSGEPGAYDLSVQLIGDGQRIDRVNVKIPGVSVASTAASPACD